MLTVFRWELHLLSLLQPPPASAGWQPDDQEEEYLSLLGSSFCLWSTRTPSLQTRWSGRSGSLLQVILLTYLPDMIFSFFQGDPHTFCLCRADQYGPRLCRPRVWFWQDYQGADDEGAEYVCKHSSNHGVLLQGIRRKSSIQDTCNLQTNIHSIFANLMQVFQGGMIFIFLTHSFFQYSGCGEKKLNHAKGTASKHLRLWLTFFTTVIYFSNIFNKILKNNIIFSQNTKKN